MNNEKVEKVGDSPNLNLNEIKEDLMCPCPPKYVSYFYRSPESTIARDIITFQHSFGYNCKKLFNLCLIDPDVLVFGSGNLIHFFRVSTREMSFRRSAGGGGIGFITVNPNPQYNYLTVAENGINPLILIYKFPELEVISVLENGAERSFTCASYSPDGELLATQGGEPCYTLTIWNWKDQSIVLRTKSFQNDVLNVIFSPYNPKQIITCGLGHIKFWKISRTFTGLKLIGELGRFGKTEICDIYAIYPMPDEKIISGCEWGNLLVWDDGLIKLEVCRKNRKPCHTAPITMITMDDGEVMSIGMDGYVRIWFWETVENADPPDNDRFVEIEPIYEFKIGTINKPCNLRCFIKIYPNDKKDNKYYAQDGNGRIWYCDINIEKVSCKSTEIFLCHNGRILSADTSSFSNHLATIGEGGYLNVYDYAAKKLLFQKQFFSYGTDLVWLSTNIDPHGTVLLLSFEDGVIRQIVINLNQNQTVGDHVYLLDVIKPHSKAITKLSINPKENILVSGSKDCTIFIFSLKQLTTHSYVKLLPIGYVNISSSPTAFDWNPKDNFTLLVGCSAGGMYEFKVPDEPCDYTNVSYHLNRITMKKYIFKSCKSKIRQQIKLTEIAKRKEKKRQQKIEKMLKLKKEKPGINIDEEMFLQDSESEEELEPLYYPKIPNSILWLRYTSHNSIWLSLGGYDAGYIYERNFNDQQHPQQQQIVDDINIEGTKNTIIPEGDDIEIHSYLILNNYLIFGMQDGSIQINLIKDNIHDLSDFWKLTMHDNLNGIITKLCKSCDEKYIFSIGYDGNVFSYKWNDKNKLSSELLEMDTKIISNEFSLIKNIQDIDDINYPSLEEQKVKEENERNLKLITENKEKILDIIAEYKLIYRDIIKRNRNLPISQRFTFEELELDKRITADLVQSMQNKLDLVRKKLEFDIEKAKLAKDKVMKYFIEPLECYPFEVSGIRSNKTVKTFRIKRLNDEFYWVKNYIEECISQEKLKKKLGVVGEDEISQKTRDSVQLHKTLLEDITADVGEINLNNRIKRILKRFEERQIRKIEFDKILKEHYENKPDINVNHKTDVINIHIAEKTIGDYKLKIDPDYKNENDNETVSQKFKQILEIREILYNLKNDYNKKIKNLRLEKNQIYDFVKKQQKVLEKIHKIIPENNRKFIPQLPEIQIDLEYPEENLKQTVNESTGIRIQSILYRKSDVHKQLFEGFDVLNNATKLQKNIAENESKEIIDIESFSPTMNFELPSYQEICDKISSQKQFLENDFKLKSKQKQNISKENIWEIEFYYNNVIRNLIEQQEIINEINLKINNFDDNLQLILNERLQIELNAKFLEQYLITLNQEFWILKDCEKQENQLLENVEDILLKCNNIQTNKFKINNLIDDERKNIEKLNEKIKQLNEQFFKMIKNNKFAKYLNRIFKKKYKPPKMSTDEDKSSSSSSDTSEFSDDDERRDSFDDGDSLQLSPIQFDENICPPGLDVKLYNDTFTLRSEKHELEQEIHTRQKKIEEKKKEVENLKFQKLNMEKQLEKGRESLNDFLREKQTLLNEIETLVVLQLDQISNFDEIKDDNTFNINKLLLFNNENITKLQNRVGQLENERLDVKNQYKIDIVHLGHMKSEIQLMKRQIIEFEEKIKIAKIKKFGKDIDIDELELMTINKYVFNKKTELEDEKKEFEKMMAKKKVELAEYEQKLIKERQLGTEKLNILSILQEEKNFLTEALIRQKKLIEKSKTKKGIDFTQDLIKLKDIEKRQQSQIEFLEKEIRTLRIKINPFNIEQKDNEFMELLPPKSENNDNNYSSTIQESKISSTLNSNIIEKIQEIVQKFLQNKIGMEISLDDITKLTRKISNYLCYVLNNFNEPINQYTTFDDDTMKCIIENFENLLTKKYLKNIKQADIINLLNNLLTMFKHEKKYECKIDELINSIIINAIDVIKQKNLNYEENFSQNVLNEIFCQIIEILSTDDMNNTKIFELICEKLIINSNFNYKTINIDELVDDVMNYVTINQIEEINAVFLKNFADTLIDKFMEISEIRNKMVENDENEEAGGFIEK